MKFQDFLTKVRLDKSDFVAAMLLGATIGVGIWLNTGLMNSHAVIQKIEKKMSDRYPRADAQKDFNALRAAVALPPATLPSTTQPAATQP